MRERMNNPPATTGSQTKIAASMTEPTAIAVVPITNHVTMNIMMTALTGMKDTIVIEEIEIAIVTVTVTTNAMMAVEGTAEMTIIDSNKSYCQRLGKLVENW